MNELSNRGQIIHEMSSYAKQRLGLLIKGFLDLIVFKTVDRC